MSVRVVGPIESEMYEKHPATKYIHEPRVHFVEGPQAIIDATEEHRKRTIEFIHSEHAQKLVAIVEDFRNRFELAKKNLVDACDGHCAAETRVIAELWRAYREKTLEKGEFVKPPRSKFHDRNWVDEEYGFEEEAPDEG